MRKSTVLSVVIAGIALLSFFLFVISGNLIPLILAFILLVVSGYARKKESYEEYRSRYEAEFGMNENETDNDTETKTSD